MLDRIPFRTEAYATMSEAELSGYRELWCSVLHFALDECRKNGSRSYIGSRDFYEVCALAGLDGEAVRSRLDAMEDLPSLNPQYGMRWLNQFKDPVVREQKRIEQIRKKEQRAQRLAAEKAAREQRAHAN